MPELDQIRGRLAALRGKIATALALDGSARVAGALLATVTLSFLLDRVFKLETAARAVLLLAGLGGLGWVAWRFVVARLGALPGEDPLALAVEARFRDLNDRLISALQLARQEDPEQYGMSPQLVEDAIREAIEPAKTVRFSDILARGRILRATLLGLVALGILAGGAAADPESARIWFKRNVLLRNVRWPQKTYLEVDAERFPGGVARIVRGEDLVVVARSVGEVHPDKVTIHFRDSEGESGRGTMKSDQTGRLYRYEFKEIAFPITFHLEGGDEETDDFHIELMEPPAVETLRIEVAFPDYAGREPVPVDLGRGEEPEMLRGGSLTLHGTATKDLEKVELVAGEKDDAILAAELTGKREFRFVWKPEDSALVGLRLRDRDGLTNPSLAPRFHVRVVNDRAPKVRLNKRGIGTMVVEGAVMPYVVRVRDDVRAVSGRIEARKTAGDRIAPEPDVLPLPDDRFGTDIVEIEGRLEISSLDVSPGAFLSFVAFSKDNSPEGLEGKSDPITVKVVTLEELFSELLRRQQEQRRLFEELIQREKRLRDRFRDLRDQPPRSPAELRIQLESEAQEQREIGRRVRAIERAMTQIFDEMLNNRVVDASRVHDLRTKVVGALERLRERTMADHATELDDHAKRAERINVKGEDGSVLDEGYARVLRAMEAVLAQMVKVEGFTEIVERVRAILELQGEVSNETRRKYQAMVRDIFRDGKPPEEDK